VSDWLARDLGPAPQSRRRIDFDGLTRIPELLSQLLGKTRPPMARAAGAHA